MLNELRDIQGIDPISWWPPAPGWWLLAVVIIVLWRWSLTRWRSRDGWRQDAHVKLKALGKRLNREGVNNTDRRAVLGELSVVLRRAAIARFGRRECAGLSGNQWLAFLDKYDPKGFDWRNRGTLMVELPYAPEGLLIEPIEVRELILAARVWVNNVGQSA